MMRDSGEGILRMAEKMEERGLPEPAFKVGEHEIWVTLRNREVSLADGGGSDSNRGELEPDRQELGPDRQELKPDRQELGPDWQELNEIERGLVAALGKRPRVEKLRIAILVLLRRRVLRPAQLAAILGRGSVDRLTVRHLSPMVQDGLLKRTNPDVPTDPKQAYFAAEGYHGPAVSDEHDA